MNNNYTTPRLSITPLTQNDAAFIHELTNTNGWIKFIGDRNIHSIADAKTYIKKIEDNPDAIYWKVNLKDSPQAIGVITLIQRDYLDDLDIGFAFLPQQAKKGYAFEASKAVLDATLKTDTCKKVYGVTQADNFKSIALLEKLGLNWIKKIENEEDVLEVYSIG